LIWVCEQTRTKEHTYNHKLAWKKKLLNIDLSIYFTEKKEREYCLFKIKKKKWVFLNYKMIQKEETVCFLSSHHDSAHWFARNCQRTRVNWSKRARARRYNLPTVNSTDRCSRKFTAGKLNLHTADTERLLVLPRYYYITWYW
jgi:hypothetical protein